ncbi:hypothetical protein [Cellulomonas fengjieae]|uniref:Uncharacterized protein n=1 Tax=Cellulomonas fengjieae TaxID=2819978 RepID=A0ABS3SHE7_9CELL|nr:hypothetical protein [Cellulomonas fengjieae]MBO3085173.1 hypothetical protein [Cellulomonas fengjieae]QVI66254.1 hypothetical protein KG102_01095 [Cellulomonas fengjieae]
MIWSGGDNDELRRLDAFATAFVAAASTDRSRNVEGVKSFPRGSCTWASFAGDELLREAGLGEWTLWNASTLEGMPRHDWLVRDDLFLDLTAHQHARFDQPLVGLGTNPLEERYPTLLGLHPTSEIWAWPGALVWKAVLEDVMAEHP